jgi:molybdopterin-biosynthesis enzyme MoeA-like protein
MVAASAPAQRLGIVVIGDELLSGRRQDRHLAHVIETFHGRGLRLAWVQYLGDDEAILVRQFRQIRQSGDICFSFGGIGGTPDDRTRQAMAAAHDVPLVRHPGAVAAIEARFGAEAYPKRILMAELPQGAELIPNPYNQIPGFSLGSIHCLPGFPVMAWPMLEWLLDEYYAEMQGVPDVQLLLTVNNIVESDIIDLMTELQNRYPHVKLSSLPHFLPDNTRQIEFGVHGKAEDANAMFRELQNALTEKGYAFVIDDE